MIGGHRHKCPERLDQHSCLDVRTGHVSLGACLIGFTALETVLVVAILGILLAVGFVAFRTPGPRHFANDLKAQLQEAKYEAVKRNAPVAVVWDSVGQTFQTRFDSALTDPCGG